MVLIGLAIHVAAGILANHRLEKRLSRYTYQEEDWRSLVEICKRQEMEFESTYHSVVRPERFAFVKRVRWPFPYGVITVWDFDPNEFEIDEDNPGSQTVIERVYTVDHKLPIIHSSITNGFLIDEQNEIVRTSPTPGKVDVMSRLARKTDVLIPNTEEIDDLASWFKDATVAVIPQEDEGSSND